MFATERQLLAARLTEAGLDVTLDPAAVPPMVLVGLPERIEPAANSRTAWTCVIPVHLVAPPPGGADAAAWLLDKLPVVLDALARSTAEPTSFPIGEKQCPAYQVDHAVTVINELRLC